MIDAHQQGHEQRAVHREMRQEASEQRLKHAMEAANKLRELAGKQREGSLFSFAADMLGVAAGVGAAFVAPAAAPAIASGVSQVGRGIYEMATAGAEQRLQAQMKEQEALADAAGADGAYHQDALEEAQQVIARTFQQLQRYSESEQRTGDLALRVAEK